MPANHTLSPGLTCIGSLLVDDIAKPQQILHAGASNPVRWTQSVGGVAANVARAAALRTKTTLISAAGNDIPSLLNHPSLHQVDCQWIKHDSAFDRYTAVLNEHGDLFVGLASTELAESLNLAAIQPLLRQPTQAYAIDANLSTECLLELVEYIDNEHTGSLIAALPISPEKAIKWRECASKVDILFCNRREAAALIGQQTHSTTDTLALIHALADCGFNNTVLTDAAKPIKVMQRGQVSSIEVPATSITGTVNGAGDALSGATLSHYLKTKDLAQSVSKAGLIAAQCVLSGSTVHYPDTH